MHVGLWHDIGTAVRGGPRVALDVLTATWELALANLAFRHLGTDDLHLLRHPVSARLTPGQEALVERVAYAMPIMGLRVPWRADCVVQALAARRWLARHGIESALCIGVRKDGRDLAAHAWLRVGERIVTGGDVSDYDELPAAKDTRGLPA